MRYAQYMDKSDSSLQRLAWASSSALIDENNPEAMEAVSGT
jgi:hypothetical protein